MSFWKRELASYQASPVGGPLWPCSPGLSQAGQMGLQVPGEPCLAPTSVLSQTCRSRHTRTRAEGRCCWLGTSTPVSWGGLGHISGSAWWHGRPGLPSPISGLDSETYLGGIANSPGLKFSLNIF